VLPYGTEKILAIKKIKTNKIIRSKKTINRNQVVMYKREEIYPKDRSRRKITMSHYNFIVAEFMAHSKNSCVENLVTSFKEYGEYGDCMKLSYSSVFLISRFFYCV